VLRNIHTRDVLLADLSSLENLEHLICDEILETYIMEKKVYLQSLSTINRVPVSEPDPKKRAIRKEALKLQDKMWRYA